MTICFLGVVLFNKSSQFSVHAVRYESCSRVTAVFRVEGEYYFSVSEIAMKHFRIVLDYKTIETKNFFFSWKCTGQTQSALIFCSMFQ